MQSYKVFINNFFILFTENFEINNTNPSFDKMDMDFFDVYEDFMSFFENKNKLINNNIVLQTNDVHKVFIRFKENFVYIPAAGGVVTNRLQKILLIHKNNIWDLPKGKIEIGETPASAAMREVFEETNLSFPKIINPSIYSTFHIYQDPFNFNQFTLKETKWFHMISNCKSLLKPQIQEGIVDVRWFTYKDLYTLQTYQSIIDPIKFFI